MPTISPTAEASPTKPVWYVYDQFSFDPITEFQFPNKEVQYRRVFNHPYSMETFSGETQIIIEPKVFEMLNKYSYFNIIELPK